MTAKWRANARWDDWFMAASGKIAQLAWRFLANENVGLLHVWMCAFRRSIHRASRRSSAPRPAYERARLGACGTRLVEPGAGTGGDHDDQGEPGAYSEVRRRRARRCWHRDAAVQELRRRVQRRGGGHGLGWGCISCRLRKSRSAASSTATTICWSNTTFRSTGEVEIPVVHRLFRHCRKPGSRTCGPWTRTRRCSRRASGASEGAGRGRRSRLLHGWRRGEAGGGATPRRVRAAWPRAGLADVDGLEVLQEAVQDFKSSDAGLPRSGSGYPVSAC